MLSHTGSSNEEVRTPSAVTSPYIPIEFDLLMQNSLTATVKASASPCVSTPPTEASTLPLLVPFTETAVKQQLNVSVGKQPRQDSDVSMLDTGISSNENSIGGNDDVQLLHSPPISTTSVASGPAPSLSDVFLKLEDIKPSKTVYVSIQNW